MKLNNFPNSPAVGRQQWGATLIEVLVTVLVLSIGMLGMASLQTRGMQFSQSAFYQSQADILAEDLLDRMRASNDGNLTLNQFLHDKDDAIQTYASCSTSCTPAELALRDLGTWLENVAVVLPNGKAEIERDDDDPTAPIFIITLYYDDSRADQATSYGQENDIDVKQFTFRTEL